MSLRTNPDRILESIDRERSRDEETAGRPSDDRQAVGRELDTTPPPSDATNPERTKRVFALVDRAYQTAAQGPELGKLASRFRGIGDLHHHHARGDVSVAVQYLDSGRPPDVGMSPFNIKSEDMAETKKETGSTRADVNAMRLLRRELRDGVMSSYKKLEPRIRDALKERADLGHISVDVTMDLRPAQ
jgi:predicted Rdx family selenoprotein